MPSTPAPRIGNDNDSASAFNVVEGLVNHHLLGLHHVNETVPESQWIYWDVGFLISGAAMVVIGWVLIRRGQRVSRRGATHRHCLGH